MFQGSNWEHVNSPQTLIAISVFGYVVWVVGRKGEIYYRDGISEHNCSGNII